MKKILLFGANGQVGMDVSDLCRVRNIDIKKCTHSDVDVTEKDSVHHAIQLYQPDVVINAAAYTRVDDAEDDKSAAFLVNKSGADNIAVACHELDVPFIHLSTDYVFDGNKQDAYREGDEVNPLSVYGESKLAGEQSVESVNGKYIILRTSWVFGVHGNNFVKTMVRLAHARESINVVADQFGCPTSTTSIAAALLEVAAKISQKNFSSWGVYHYCGTPVTNWYEFATLIVKCAGNRFDLKAREINAISTEQYPVKATRPRYSVLNCEKIKREFNIKQSNWHDDVNTMINDSRFRFD